MFVIVLTYVRPLEEVDRWLAEHVAFLDRQFDDGVFLLAGPRVPRTGGVILADGVDRAALEAIVATDPFMREGVATADVVEFVAGRGQPALASFLARSGG